MGKRFIKVMELLKKAKEIGWSVNSCDEYITLGKPSPAGQDFSMDIELNEDDTDKLIKEIHAYHESFDVSYEAYVWLGQDGHGMNGAPYDMRDLYDDMEACKENIKELYDTLKQAN